VLPQKKNIENFEVSQKFSRLGKRVMLVSMSYIIRDNNEDPSILLAIEDSTEKRKAEMEQKSFALELERQVAERTFAMHEANKNLQQSNAALEQFAYIASHDLQEPLRKIRTFASLLHDRYTTDLPGEAKELINKISASSQRMSKLVRNVLDFSKITHDDSAIEKTDLNAIVYKIRDDFDMLIMEKNATIICEPLAVIEAIPSQIDMLFSNLISNALKFSKSGIPPIVTITSRTLPLNEVEVNPLLNPLVSYCEINFQDNGIGFDQQFEEKIFSVFTRLHNEKKFAGTGIGLAACKKIVLNHHGLITATSKEGAGALFKVILPVKY
jgi:two-component system CheB/CheR fusion protein